MAQLDGDGRRVHHGRLASSMIWIAERLDTLAALAAGVVAVCLGILGAVSGDELTTATLGVLTVVAFSLVRGRNLRLSTGTQLSEVRRDLQHLQTAVSTGAPYHLVLHEVRWDLKADGSAQSVSRRRLRFLQNEVVSIADWSQGDGMLASDARYLPGSAVHPYSHNGRRYQLIALDRVYARGEELDFKVERDINGVFPSSPDRAGVLTLDPTTTLKIVVRWPVDRPARNVRLKRLDPAQQVKSTQDVTKDLRKEDGRQFYCIEEPEPILGGRTIIEWDW